MSEALMTKPRKPTTEPERIWPEDNVGYLLDARWKPLGHPRDPFTRWLDPTKPDKDEEKKVLVGTETLSNGRVEDVYQIHVLSRGLPMTLQDAVHRQMVRDGKLKR